MITFYIISKRLHLKRKGLSDARVVSITKKEILFQYIFCKDSKIWNFPNKKNVYSLV